MLLASGGAFQGQEIGASLRRPRGERRLRNRRGKRGGRDQKGKSEVEVAPMGEKSRKALQRAEELPGSSGGQSRGRAAKGEQSPERHANKLSMRL